jgi:hypothetical protein
MMFPPNPQPGDTYKSWTWDGTQWTCGGGNGGGTPGTGQPVVIIGPDPPTGVTAGALWFNTDNNTLYVFDGTTWEAVSATVATGTDPPLNPPEGQLWLDASGVLWSWDGTQWVQITTQAGNAIVSPTPPSSPALGALWHNSSTGQLYVYSGSQWVLIGPEGAVTSPSPPANPTVGMMWLNPTTGDLSVWDGSGWIIMGTPPPDLSQGGTIDGNLDVTGSLETGGGILPGQGIVGVTNGSDAAAGMVGEYQQTYWTDSIPALGSGTVTVTVPLPPGDWDCNGVIGVASADLATSQTTTLIAEIVGCDLPIDNIPGLGDETVTIGWITESTVGRTVTLPGVRASLSATTEVGFNLTYRVTVASIGYAWVAARRIR